MNLTSSIQRLFEDILWINEIKTTSYKLLVGKYFLKGIYEHSSMSSLTKKKLVVLLQVHMNSNG
jgi:hypothetical protein